MEIKENCFLNSVKEFILKDLQEKNWDKLLNIKQLRMYANELRE